MPAAMRRPELILWDPCGHRRCLNGPESRSGAFDQRLDLQPHLRAVIGAPGCLTRRGGQRPGLGRNTWSQARRLWGSIIALLPLADLLGKFCE